MSLFDGIRNKIIDIINETFNKDNEETNSRSNYWLEYFLGPTPSHCDICFKRNNKVYAIDNYPTLPEHENCLCYLKWLRRKLVGEATRLEKNGADYWLKVYGRLPNYYITKTAAKSLGWDASSGNLHTIKPKAMIGGDIFYNREYKLPNSYGRIWYECDIDYSGGYRNAKRIIYSNDGLLFMTDNHYTRFIVIE